MTDAVRPRSSLPPTPPSSRPQFVLITLEMLALAIAYPYSFPTGERMGQERPEAITSELAQMNNLNAFGGTASTLFPEKSASVDGGPEGAHRVSTVQQRPAPFVAVASRLSFESLPEQRPAQPGEDIAEFA